MREEFVSRSKDSTSRSEQELQVDRQASGPMRLFDLSTEEALFWVAAGTSGNVGEGLFRTLVQHLAGALQMRFGFVSEIVEDTESQLRMLALWNGTHLSPNFEYDCRGTPCEQVIGKKIAFFPSKVREKFPEDLWLKKENVESYLAIPLFDKDGGAIGHLGVMDDKPMDAKVQAESLLRIFAARASAELQRRRVEESLKCQKEMLEKIVNNLPVMITSYTADGIQVVNKEFERVLGWSLEEVQGIDLVSECYPDPKDREEVLDLMRNSPPGWRRVRTRTRDGRFVSDSWTNIRLWDGVSIGIGSDITEREKAENELLQYRNRLRSLASEISLAEGRDRKRIAAELHNRTIQTLALAKIKLGAIQEALSSEVSGSQLGDIRDLIEQSIQDTRSLVFELSPPILHDLGFVAAVEWLVDHIGTQFGIRCRAKDDGEPKALADDVQMVLFQSVRELLINVGKHAAASEATVRLKRLEDEILIEVQDNGKGFDPEATVRQDLNRGFGLFSIQERLDLLGGSMEIQSSPGRGARVRLKARLASKKEESL